MQSGEVVALLGPSGSGETTSLRAIAGLDWPDQGDIKFDGVSTGGRPVVECRRSWKRKSLILAVSRAFTPSSGPEAVSPPIGSRI